MDDNSIKAFVEKPTRNIVEVIYNEQLETSCFNITVVAKCSELLSKVDLEFKLSSMAVWSNKNLLKRVINAVFYASVEKALSSLAKQLESNESEDSLEVEIYFEEFRIDYEDFYDYYYDALYEVSSCISESSNPIEEMRDIASKFHTMYSAWSKHISLA